MLQKLNHDIVVINTISLLKLDNNYFVSFPIWATRPCGISQIENAEVISADQWRSKGGGLGSSGPGPRAPGETIWGWHFAD